MVLADVHAEVAALLGLVRAVGALVRRRLAAALHVLVPSQRRLPAVLLAAVPALKLPAGVVARAAAVAPLRVARALVRLGAEAVQRVRLFGQHDVVRVVVLVRVGLLALGGAVVVRERLLQQVRLDVLGDVERVARRGRQQPRRR